MSGSRAARDAILKALRDAYAPVWQAGKDYADAYALAIARDDLVEAMAGAVNVLEAASHLKDVAELAERDARMQLALTMEETGAHQIQAGNTLAYLVRKPVYVSIDDAAAIPAEYMHTPPPTPDKRAIKTAIDEGTNVPGASLIRPNTQTLAIRHREKT